MLTVYGSRDASGSTNHKAASTAFDRERDSYGAKEEIIGQAYPVLKRLLKTLLAGFTVLNLVSLPAAGWDCKVLDELWLDR